MRCAEWLRRHEVNVAPALVSRSLGAVAREVRIHPVRDYLQSAWDGERRLETWAVAFLGAEDAPLARAFGALWMISALAGIMRPGVRSTTC